MEEKYLQLAKAHENLAACYRQMASQAAEEDKTMVRASDKQTASVEQKPEVTIEQVRAVLAQKSQDGKKKEVKDLLLKYDSGKLSGVKIEDYPALLKDAETL